MRKPKDIRECAHYWAHQTLPSAKCGSVSYDGPHLYSYAARIATLISDDKVVISDHHWSVTTSSHQSLARQATSHMRVCYAPYLDSHRENRQHWEREAENALIELKQHPRRKKSCSDRITSAVQSYNAYRQFFELDWPEMTSDEMKKLVEERATERAVEEVRRKERMREELLRREAEEATELLFWRNHQTERRSFFKTALRLSLDGKEIETTHGARVPVEVAPLLWRLVNSRLRGEKFEADRLRVGHYHLTSIEADGTLVIGCHTIPYDELVYMAKKLNFIKEDSNGIESDRIGHDANIYSASGEASNGRCCTPA